MISFSSNWINTSQPCIEVGNEITSQEAEDNKVNLVLLGKSLNYLVWLCSVVEEVMYIYI